MTETHVPEWLTVALLMVKSVFLGFFLYCLWSIATSLDALLELAKKPI